MERTIVTISDAAPHNWPPRALMGEGGAALLLGVENSVDFVIGPDVAPIEAMERAYATAALLLPRLLKGAPYADRTGDEVQAVLQELVDVTARHCAGAGLVARIAYDGGDVTVSVGDMTGALPAPEVEPGLYLVYRLASDVGQHVGDHGGWVTWASVPCSR
ncbi:hypothetical protein SAMN05216483_6714 [Streptomyces sp. 2131.1]|uniref:hypothetical protein n=1 Tax=Streptomyces sp. 2131.1 TaxID=1855346 RepID=UPI0008968573|nr:hypothetical protein [Streptomyces sp. 2131.1]SEE83561.1 hypothetical protein SAMN05216483_6714 [Streptomyces sp. 2131.1]